MGIVTQLTICNLLNQHFPGQEERTPLHDLVPVINLKLLGDEVVVFAYSVNKNIPCKKYFYSN